MSSRRTQEEDGPPMNLNQLEVSLMPVTCLMKNTPHIHCRKTKENAPPFTLRFLVCVPSLSWQIVAM